MTTLTVVRHGNTFATGEVPRRIGARTDLPLVASGVAQGEVLGRWFAKAGIRFDRVLASPLRRTRETAALVLAVQAEPPPIEPAGWLAEIDHGPDENRTDAEIVARIGSEALRRWDEAGAVPPGWQVDVPARLAAWRDLYAEAARGSGNLLIVTSNGAARFALMAEPDLLAAAGALPSLKLRTGAWGTIAVDGAGGLRLLEWDRRPD